MYTELLQEIECIKDAWGMDTLEAFEYIQRNFEEYEDTIVGRQFRQFRNMARDFFAEA